MASWETTVARLPLATRESVPEAQRANAAPPVLEFDTAGKLLASWGGPGGLSPALQQRIRVDNPLETYPRLKESVQ